MSKTNCYDVSVVGRYALGIDPALASQVKFQVRLNHIIQREAKEDREISYAPLWFVRAGEDAAGLPNFLGQCPECRCMCTFYFIDDQDIRCETCRKDK